MAIVSINKKTFENKVGKLTQELKEKISMLGCPIEDETDTELLLEISPNRPDLLSEQGITRAVLSFIGKKTGLREYKSEKSDYEVIIDKSVEKIRPFTACAVVKDLALDNAKIKEIIDIQEKLHSTYGRNRKKIAIGIYPSEKITFPIYYRALPPEKIKFRPLESSTELSASDILKKTTAGKEYGHLLEGKKKFPIFADSKGEIMSMPPIINSHATGKITEITKDVFIECSGFDFLSLSKCLNILVTALADMGGKICKINLKYAKKELSSPNLSPEKIKLNGDNVNKILGLELKEKEIFKYLEKMGFGYGKGGGKEKEVLIPSYRADIMHAIDLIEDIAIAYGYENFKPALPQISTIGKESKIEILKQKIAEILVGLGLQETCSYSLTNKQDECKKMNTKEELIGLLNAKTTYNALRTRILPSLMKILSENRSADYPQRIFETGTVFKKNREIEEKESLAIAITNSNFTEAKQILGYFLSALGLEASILASSHDSFIEGRTGKISLKGKEIGVIGELHPKVLSSWKIDVPVSAFEIYLDYLF